MMKTEEASNCKAYAISGLWWSRLENETFQKMKIKILKKENKEPEVYIAQE